jgi:hypothetical protein
MCEEQNQPTGDSYNLWHCIGAQVNVNLLMFA